MKVFGFILSPLTKNTWRFLKATFECPVCGSHNLFCKHDFEKMREEKLVGTKVVWEGKTRRVDEISPEYVDLEGTLVEKQEFFMRTGL